MRTWVALGAVAWLAGCGEEPSEGAPSDAAQVRRVPDADALFADLAARAGRPLLVNLWAMWCAPCVEELPDLVAVHDRMRAAGGEVVGIAMDLSAPGQELEGVAARLPAFLAERGVGYPILLYVDGDPMPLIQEFELKSGALPITIAIDREGQRVAVHYGKAGPQELEELAARAAGG